VRIKATTVFEKNHNALNTGKYKYIINSGSSRSSKTFSILQLFWVLAWSNERIKLAAFRITKKDCKDTILQDMLKYYPTLDNWDKVVYNKSESYFTFPNGSQIFIEGTDDELKVMGYHSDYLWFNEFYKLSKETFDQLDMRCSNTIFMDYNPVGNHWADSVMKRDNAIVIHSTFKDNPFIPIEQKKKILSYEPTEYNVKQGTSNEYNWQVFGLGLKAEKQGRIYNWNEINYYDYLNIEKQTYYGCDWGLVDPFAIVEVKYHDGNLYVHELNYKSENELRKNLTTTELHQINANQDEGLVSWMFTKLNIPKDKIIVCDSNRPTKIIALRRSGWEYAVSVGGKTRLIDRIGTMQGLNVYYTSTSKNIEFEQENYSYQKDRFGVTLENPEDGNDHLINAIEYIAQKLFEMNIIKNI